MELRWFVSAVLAEGKADGSAFGKSLPPDLKPAQWELASQLLDALRPFKAATTFLSAQLTVSVSCALPVIYSLKAKLAPDRKDKDAIRQFKQRCRSDLCNRWSLDNLGLNAVSVLSCAVDPRFKKLSFLSQEQVIAIHDAITSKLAVGENVHESSSASYSTDSAIEPSAKRAKPDSSLDYLFGPENDDARSSSDDASEEVTRFVSEPVAPRTADPLHWWNKNAARYPKLAVLAMSLLCVPATSTPAERIFSAAGNIITKKRASLLPSNADALIFLNRNWKLPFSRANDAPVHLAEVTRAEVEVAENPVLPPLPDLRVEIE